MARLTEEEKKELLADAASRELRDAFRTLDSLGQASRMSGADVLAFLAAAQACGGDPGSFPRPPVKGERFLI